MRKPQSSMKLTTLKKKAADKRPKTPSSQFVPARSAPTSRAAAVRMVDALRRDLSLVLDRIKNAKHKVEDLAVLITYAELDIDKYARSVAIRSTPVNVKKHEDAIEAVIRLTRDFYAAEAERVRLDVQRANIETKIGKIEKGAGL